ncbi:MAG: glycosyltransferase family A protein [Candidatus Korobacteraceae bacterium]|jgi:glycosyltransferase involved in cell wall biosynthesis
MRFTVLTPTYNRAHTLKRVYDSLCAQSFRDFEWIIVDDGSSDGTRGLVSSWQQWFPIRYFWQRNGGKHTAMNRGVAAATGEFVVFLDSDDECKPNALERFDFRWRQIPDPGHFSTLIALTCRPDGSIRGEVFPEDHVDAFRFADQYRLRGKVDRWGINRTDTLREFPFPEGERFVPEALVWNRLARKYAARFFNEVLLVMYPSGDSLSRRMVDLRASSPKSTLTYYRELAASPLPAQVRLHAALNYCRFAALTASRRCRPGGVSG